MRAALLAVCLAGLNGCTDRSRAETEGIRQSDAGETNSAEFCVPQRRCSLALLELGDKKFEVILNHGNWKFEKIDLSTDAFVVQIFNFHHSQAGTFLVCQMQNLACDVISYNDVVHRGFLLTGGGILVSRSDRALPVPRRLSEEGLVTVTRRRGLRFSRLAYTELETLETHAVSVCGRSSSEYIFSGEPRFQSSANGIMFSSMMIGIEDPSEDIDLIYSDRRQGPGRFRLFLQKDANGTLCARVEAANGLQALDAIDEDGHAADVSIVDRFNTIPAQYPDLPPTVELAGPVLFRYRWRDNEDIRIGIVGERGSSYCSERDLGAVECENWVPVREFSFDLNPGALLVRELRR